MRKMASIQKIVDIQPIDGADRVELARVLGWQVVIAKKDNFRVGDNVVYVEVDSQMPEKPEYEFLRERKFRVRTIKLRKQLSQGLILPISILPNKRYSEGQDVSEILSIIKYDPESELEERLNQERIARENNKIKKYLSRYSWFRKIFNPKKSGKFPEFIKKTDETRLQAMPQVLSQYANIPMIVTEKVDGQSVTFYLFKNKKWLFFENYEFGVCSRNLRLPRPDNSNWWNVAKNLKIENVLKSLFNDVGAEQYVVLQGEICGIGIQGNKYNLNGLNFFAFNLIIDGKQYDTAYMESKLKDYDIDSVPVITEHLTFHGIENLDELIAFSNDKSVLYDTLREGVVIRDYDNTISFKIISPDFLLKHNL